MSESPNYYAILTANVRYSKLINANEKLLFAEITALSNSTGICWASNNYFANLFDMTPQAISKWIRNLEKNHFIKCNYVYKKCSKEIEKREIVCINHSLEGINNGFKGINHSLEGYQHTIKDNNTSINNKSNNRVNKFTPPTFEEIEKYVLEKNINIDTKQFFDYFDVANWIDSKGNKVKNWKQKLLTWANYNKPKNESNSSNNKFGGWSD